MASRQASSVATTPRVSTGNRVREITTELLVQSSKLTVGKTESLEQYLKRVTHLALNGDDKKVIQKIQRLEKCPNLKVLYMYDNEINGIENMDKIAQLTHLHLQNNRIRTMTNLDALPQLEKLYIDGNRIPRLEGLGNCLYLQELHMSNQILAKNEVFSFDEATIRALSRSLRVLNLSNCRVHSTRALQGLRGLQQLDLSKNEISDLEDVFGLLGSLSALAELDLRGNPVTNASKYREKAMTFSSSRLALLDKKDIDANQRRMMQSHLAHKFQKRQDVESSSNSTSNQGSSSSSSTAASETIRKMKHGSIVHQLRNMHITTSGKTTSPQSLVDLGVAGAACPTVTALVRSSSGSSNNSKHV